ncbi:unnamed protein product [Acanthoscelides obtectus]|uniref:C2H2-type domain-containing protein n=1 Tax=Acanthoscelides obtectus TaxID=200917 RepID=A0A9P0K366_ACAOB|nr:unnamed protein product [Acanthoscelides obtectus]CAK1632107.1 hypothetical protein AOBTE_LOCUS7368 [Acanthoscelides obtectus]
MLCHVCSEGFRTKFILTRHLKEMHGEVLPITSSGVCPLCDVDVKNGDNILAHLEKAHQVTVESEKLYFKSIEDFEQWREHICIDSLNHFAKARGVDNVKDGQRMYLNCHYSGKQRDRGSGIRQRNSDRICKRGKVCPARLVVTCTSEGVEVIYYKTHVGHSNDVKCLRLTRTEKEQIANLLLNDIPHQKIIEEMRKSMPPSRRGAVKMQDLYNIRRDFNIDCAKVIMRTHDLSLDISKDMVHSIQPNIWKVTSNNGEYTVVFSTKAKCQGCHLLCWVCDVCVHQFSCTCNDNLVKGGFCEHIHACARLQKLKVFIETNAEPANGEDHIYCITQEIVPEEQKVENSTDSRYKLSFLLNASLGIISALDHEGCEKALPIVKKCIDDIMLLKRKQIAVEIERSDHNYSRPTESE